MERPITLAAGDTTNSLRAEMKHLVLEMAEISKRKAYLAARELELAVALAKNWESLTKHQCEQICKILNEG